MPRSPPVAAAVVPHDRVGLEGEAPCRSNHAVAPIPEAVAIAVQRDCGCRDQIVGPFEIGEARCVDVERRDDGGGLREFVGHLAPDMNTHGLSPEGRYEDPRWSPPTPQAPDRLTPQAGCLNHMAC